MRSIFCHLGRIILSLSFALTVISAQAKQPTTPLNNPKAIAYYVSEQLCGEMQLLGDLHTRATGLSADGSTVAGSFGFIPGRWTEAAGWESLPTSQSWNSIGISDMSADGSALAGLGITNMSNTRAFRWTETHGFQNLGTLGTAYEDSYVTKAISGDGSTVVGSYFQLYPSYLRRRGFRWTQATGMTSIGGVFGYTDWEALDVNYNGSVVVGYAKTNNTHYATVWDLAMGVSVIGPANSDSTAFGVSADGSVVVGQLNKYAFRWTQETGAEGLGTVPGYEYASQATGVSADGRVIVGWVANAAFQRRAFRWTQDTGMVDIGSLPGWEHDVEATAVSADGSVVVGNLTNAQGYRAFRWVLTVDPSQDCNNNCIDDNLEILNDPSLDLDGNGLIDACEIAADPSLDCNNNGILDSVEIAMNPSLDCNGNGIIDECEITMNPSLDCDADGVLDVCQVPGITADTGLLGPLNGTTPVELVLSNPPEASSIVRVTLTLKGDFGQQVEIAQLRMNGFLLDSYFSGTNPLYECPMDPFIFMLTLSADDFNFMRTDTTVFSVAGSPAVSASECPDGVTRIQVQYFYKGAPDDCNGNGIPDLCDLEIFGGSSLDENFNFIPDECEETITPPLGDINGDDVVDGADLGLLLGAWGNTGGPADLNGDGLVDGADLGLLLGNWSPY